MERLIGLMAVPTAAIVAVLAVWGWLRLSAVETVELRVPIKHPRDVKSDEPKDFTGTLRRGKGRPSDDPGEWPCFRGANRDNVAASHEKLLREWPESGPTRLWSIPLGEGYAGPAVRGGRVYLIDYDRDNQADVIRCLSFANGEDIWRYAYPVAVKRNHGMSRTVPAVTDDAVVTIGPKCHVHALNPDTGELLWKMDLVAQFGTTVPPWYAGQCPLIDQGRLILAPCGKDSLMMAMQLKTGEVLWQIPNSDGWKMTHTSILATTFGGVRQYIYLSEKGIIGVKADDGSVLWRRNHPIPKKGVDWKDLWKTTGPPIATPVDCGDGRILFTAGYNAGSTMLQLSGEGTRPACQSTWRHKANEFSSDQQTPICFREHLYTTNPPIKEGRLACASLDGNVLWETGSDVELALGPYVFADGLMLGLSEDGTLFLLEISPSGYKVLAKAKVLDGHEAWAPMALVGGKLLVRDLTEMRCLEVGRRTP